jgi:hypothetical protein
MTKPIIRPIHWARFSFFITCTIALYWLTGDMLSLEEENNYLLIFGISYSILFLLMLSAKSYILEKAIYIPFFAIGGLIAFCIAAFSHMGPLFG